MSALVYVLPVHQEEKVLEGNVLRLREHLEGEDAEIFLVENGSSDRSWELSQSLEERWGDAAPPVRAFREADAGIGYAYHRGLTEALERFGPSPDRWAILTAADLPFGMTDLEAARPLLSTTRPRILMGSKAHPRSQADRGAKRKVMSAAFRLLRRAIIDMRVGDSQGSVFVRLDLAAELLPTIRARGFFYSTELCHRAETLGEDIVELPVSLFPSGRASTVRPLKHGSEMGRELLRLRREARRG